MKFVRTIAACCSKICELTNLISFLLSLSVLKKHNVYNKKHLFGITTLDVVRANAFVADNLKISPIGMESVTVVGGHAGTTILPLLSQGD